MPKPQQHFVNAGGSDAEHQVGRDGDPVTSGFKPRKHGGRAVHVYGKDKHAKCGSREQ
jgi:hypothetical protein